MRNTIITVLAIVLLGVCILSGGCSKANQEKIKEWQDLIKIPVDKESTAQKDPGKIADKSKLSDPTASQEKTEIQLYFADSKGKKLVMEERDIAKAEGIARRTMEELLKGPANVESVQVIPDGTRLLDINVKPDGLCIVDLSSEARGVMNEEQEKLMIYAVANTLSQFPTIKEVSFMIDGQKVDQIGGYMNLDSPVQANYDL